MLLEITHYLQIVLDNPNLLTVIKTAVCLFYGFIIAQLIRKKITKKNTNQFVTMMLFIIVGELMTESTHIVKFFLETLKIQSPSIINLFNFYVRLAWIGDIAGALALSLLIEKIAVKNFRITTLHKILFIPGIVLSALFTYFAFFNFNIITFTLNAIKPNRSYLENITIFITCGYISIINLPAISIAIREMIKKPLPKLLLSQLKIFILFLILPHIFLKMFSVNPFAILTLTEIIRSHVFQTLYTVFLLIAMYFASRKMIGLRFLNFQSHVQPTATRFNFVQDFKEIIDQLSFVTTATELKRVTQEFCKSAFNIPQTKAALFIRSDDEHSTLGDEPLSGQAQQIHLAVEQFINKQMHDDPTLSAYINKTRILIKDEIEFTNFYDTSRELTTIIHFMDAINADVFLPIYDKQTIIAYIIIDSNARPRQFYTTDDRDEMLIFVQYLGALINLLKNRNLDSLIIREKELKEELYHKHQEINQYKESVRSFLRSNKERKIGIVFYKSRKFVYANQAAQELIDINLNTQNGHPLTLAFKSIVRHVLEYKSAHIIHTKDEHGKRLILSGIPSLEDAYVIIAVYYPEISDVIKEHLDALKDPSQWDYLLYLETTESGKLINQLIPGNGETLINWKIDLLRTALSKKATLLQVPHEDLQPTVELLHHLSMRDRLHNIVLTGPEKNHAIAIELFGLNPLLAEHGQQTTALLEKLDVTGTLYLENIHFLSPESQTHLAEYLKYGLFRMFKSDRKRPSNVRIICSTTHDLSLLVEQGVFSRDLFNELTKVSLKMPPLSTLSSQELCELTDGFTEQAITTKDLKHLVALSEKEKSRIISQRPASLHELRAHIQSMLTYKSSKKHLDADIEFDPAFAITDQELAHAIRLGKHALKDPQIMTFLWNKFKSQTKIATLLGVNRSSVNRRCQQYSLTESIEQH